MINMNVYVYAGLLQLLIVLVLLSLFLYFRIRQLKHRLGQKQVRVRELEQKPDAGQYLATETKLTRGRYEATTAFQEGEPNPGDKSFLCALRADFLELEHELAGKVERDESFWKQVEEKLGAILKAHKLSAPRAPQPLSATSSLEDSPATQTIIDSQGVLIDSIKERIGRAVPDEGVREALEIQVDILAQNNRELSDCVAMLEDENGFLRTQVRALVD